jgi:hypothetical protein
MRREFWLLAERLAWRFLGHDNRLTWWIEVQVIDAYHAECRRHRGDK